MSDVLLFEIDPSSHRSIGLFILTIDLQYNALSEIIPTWNLRNLTICMTIVLKFQQATYTSSRSRKRNIGCRVVVFVFLSLPQMQCAYVTLYCDVDETLIIGRGCLNLLCTFPGGHWIRVNIQCGHRKVVCLFKQETSEGARWPLRKRGRSPTTRHGNIDGQINSLIDRNI